MQELDTIVIGAGQAGLAASHELTARDNAHVVLERGQIGQSWRDRWDTFCLVTPNWSVRLPGYPYDGDDPDGFMPRDEIVAYLERYAAHFDAPVIPDTHITEISKPDGENFVVRSDRGAWRAPHLVVSTGAYQKPKTPAGADSLPATVTQMQIGDFSSEAALPDGDVLIVGSGQSGCQIAEELKQAGRRVVLACGRAPWTHRQFWGHDIFWWFIESGFLDALAKDMPEEARLFANVLATGHDGGHDLSLRTLDAMGVELAGRFLGAQENIANFADDLGESIAWGDARYAQIKEICVNAAGKSGISVTDIPEPSPFHPKPVQSLDLASFGTVLFTGGFRPDYRSWLPWQEAFDPGGFPIHSNGSSTVVDGLHFVGVHFLRTRKSALLYGVGEDAEIVASSIAGS